MKISFLVNYGFYPLSDENERIRANVSVFIPKEQGYDDIPLYCCGKIGDCEINLDNGIDSGNGDLKVFYVEFHDESPEELNKKIDYAIEQYRKQVLLNIEIVKKIQDRKIIIDLPEPPYE
jgi:hypothetical protein